MQTSGFFQTNPVFTRKQLTQFLAEKGPVNARTLGSILTYHKKKGRIIHVGRRLYAVVPPNIDPKDFLVDPYLVAAKITPDAVLGYHTALGFHGKAHSVHGHFTYLTAQQPRPFEFQGGVFWGVMFPKALRRKNQENFDVAVVERMGIPVRVTRLERTLVDILDRPRLCGSWEDIWRALESIEFFDLDKVIEYALLLGNATTVAKVGFFLEQHQDTLMVDNAHLKTLQALRPKRPHYLMRNERSGGRLVKNWNLVVPPLVLERSWAEVT